MLAIFHRALEEGAFTFGCFLNQKWRAAFGAGFVGNGFVPACEGTIRISAASVKDLPAFGLFFRDFSGASGHRAGYSKRGTFAVCMGGLGVLAVRVSAACQELTETTLFDQHGFSAFAAYFALGQFKGWLHRVNQAFFITFVVSGIGALRVGVAGDECSVFSDFDVEFAFLATGAGKACGESYAFTLTMLSLAFSSSTSKGL